MTDRNDQGPKWPKSVSVNRDTAYKLGIVKHKRVLKE